MIRITTPLVDVAALSVGDEVLLSGRVYGARDQAHQRMMALLNAGEPLPVLLQDEVIYYVGPAPTPPGHVIGSAGPTTSGRMDPFTPRLLETGLRGMIGKGPRSAEVVASIRRHGAVYFYAYGGCGALYARTVRARRIVAFEELGPEALIELQVEAFPVIVAVDSRGDCLFNARG